MLTTRRCWVGESLIRTLHTCTRDARPPRSIRLVASLYRQRRLAPKSYTLIQRVSRATTSFNERRGASSSEGGEEFEYRVSTYLPTFFFYGGGAY